MSEGSTEPFTNAVFEAAQVFDGQTPPIHFSSTEGERTATCRS